MIDYSAEWYEKNYHPKAKWYGDMDTASKLINWYHNKFRAHLQRFRVWFQGVNLNQGELLELGFNTGKTAYYMAKTYPNLIIDGIDFSREVKHIGDLLVTMMPQIRSMQIADVSAIPFHANSYNFVTALDLFEHLPEGIYQKTIDEINRVLRPNGLVFVYTGQEVQEEHIHIIPAEKVVVDFVRRRILPVHIIEDFLILRKLKDEEFPELTIDY